MKKYKEFTRSTQLYLEATKLILATLPLQRRVQNSTSKLAAPGTRQPNALNPNRIRNLKDEIFGCQIEIQALRVKARRLGLEARDMRVSEIGQPAIRRRFK